MLSSKSAKAQCSANTEVLRRKGKEVGEFIAEIEKEKVEGRVPVPVLLSVEGRIWSSYYRSFNVIMEEEGFEMDTRRDKTAEAIRFFTQLRFQRMILIRR